MTVQLTRGLFDLSDEITPKTEVIIQGEGKATTLRQNTSGKGGFVLAAAAGGSPAAQDFSIRNLHLQAGHAACAKAIDLGSVARVLIEDIWIDGETQNTERWTGGISIYDALAGNYGSRYLRIERVDIFDIASALGNAGIYINGPAAVKLNGVYVHGNAYLDGTAVTTHPDVGILAEGGVWLDIDDCHVQGSKHGLVLAPHASDSDVYYLQASVGGLVADGNCAYTWPTNSTFIPDSAGGGNALMLQGGIAGFHVSSCIFTPPSAGKSIQFDTPDAAGCYFNSVYFSRCNINGLIHILNSSAVSEDNMGPIVFAFCNMHTAAAHTRLGPGPQKVRFVGNERWTNDVGITVDAGSTPLNVQVLGDRFYDCAVEIAWNNTGSKKDVIIADCLPKSVNFIDTVHVNRTAAQAIPTGAWTAIQFGGERYDDDGWHSLAATAPVTTIAFVDGGGGNDSITDSGNDLAQFANGDVIRVFGSASNDGVYTVVVGGVVGTIEVATGSLTTEAAGATVIVTRTTMLTVPYAMKVRIESNVNFAGDATGLRAARLRLNDATSLTNDGFYAAQAIGNFLRIGIEWDMAADDYVEVEVWHNKGSDLDAGSVAEFTMTRIP